MDLLVISHIDDDHIAGILRFIKTQRKALSHFKEIWFNGREHLNSTNVETFDVQQGVLLGAHLEKFSGWNQSFSTNAVCIENMTSPIKIGEMEVTILSPTLHKLDRLAGHWDQTIKKREEATQQKALKRLGKEDFAVVSPQKPPAIDQSKPNGSSIAICVKYKDRFVVLCGDAHPGVLTDSLKSNSSSHGKFDIVALPHHGSAANVTETFLEFFSASNYLISTDSSKPNRPDLRSLELILNASTCGETKLWFNYEPPQEIKTWLDKHAKDKLTWGYGNSSDGITITLE